MLAKYKDFLYVNSQLVFSMTKIFILPRVFTCNL